MICSDTDPIRSYIQYILHTIIIVCKSRTPSGEELFSSFLRKWVTELGCWSASTNNDIITYIFSFLLHVLSSCELRIDGAILLSPNIQVPCTNCVRDVENGCFSSATTFLNCSVFLISDTLRDLWILISFMILWNVLYFPGNSENKYQFLNLKLVVFFLWIQVYISHVFIQLAITVKIR